jgi:hypothetical protein
MTRLNKDFHIKFQPIGSTTYRIKAGIACQTSTYQDYLNLQSFLKKMKFRLMPLNKTIPNLTGWLSKASLLPPLEKPFGMNYLLLGLQFKITSL